ncbi:MAG: glycosyltransferase family 4 protein [Ktedonobacterales bacterium]
MTTSTQPAAPASPPRVLLVISAQPPAHLDATVAAGREPRRDYQALQAALHADLLTPADARRTRLGRLIARAAGIRPALAWTAFRRRRAYDVLYTDGENVGLPLALLLTLRRAHPGQPRHVMLTHYLSTRPKRILFRLGAGAHIDTLIVHSSAQRQLAITTLRMPPARVALLPYFADATFWHPLTSSSSMLNPPSSPLPLPSDPSISVVLNYTPPIVCAVGLEFRDYDTLAQAARGLHAYVRIAAASTWSHHSAFTGTPNLPRNVTVQSYTYLPLRDLYAAARVVAVPLHEVDNQAGITVILEAMAMGKPVVVTATRGQTDVVRDRRNGGRGRVTREEWPAFAEASELSGSLAHLPTGFYVAPADPDELRRAIQYLLDHPDLAETLGRNGRRHVEALYTLDAFAARFAAAIRGEIHPLLPFSAPDY